MEALSSQGKLSLKQWPSMSVAIPRIINESPAERWERESEGKRCPIEIFNCSKPALIPTRPPLLKLYRDIKRIWEKYCDVIINIESIQEKMPCIRGTKWYTEVVMQSVSTRRESTPRGRTCYSWTYRRMTTCWRASIKKRAPTFRLSEEKRWEWWILARIGFSEPRTLITHVNP